MSESHDPHNLRKFLETPQYHDMRMKMQAEIQHPRTNIDRKCFAKTQAEKDMAKVAKSNWKLSNRLNP